MNKSLSLALVAGLTVAGSAAAQVGDINSFSDSPRFFNDIPGSTLAYTSVDAPLSLSVVESNPAGGGGFANRHIAFFSNDGGASRRTFIYEQSFDICTQVRLNTLPANVGGEIGFQTEPFGPGFFGVLPHNGEIAAFGGFFPYFSTGVNGWTGQTDFMLRMIYTAGNGDGTGAGNGTIDSTIEYLYDLTLPLGDVFQSSGLIVFTNGEGGLFEVPGQPIQIGVGVQNNFGAGLQSSDVLFSNFSIAVPAPASAGLFGLGLLMAGRRRR